VANFSTGIARKPQNTHLAASLSTPQKSDPLSNSNGPESDLVWPSHRAAAPSIVVLRTEDWFPVPAKACTPAGEENQPKTGNDKTVYLDALGGVAASTPPQASRYIQGSSPQAPEATLESVPCACVRVSPLYDKPSMKMQTRLATCAHALNMVCTPQIGVLLPRGPACL